MTTERIPFQIDTERVIELLAKHLYQSPLALLRENTQNAYDAILMRRAMGSDFTPEISISIAPGEIVVRDNGIGMTPEDLRNHFWFAGSSSKNTAQARAAGVVGTFGVGAMANFGIAGELIVETESVETARRTRSRAVRQALVMNQECIDVEALASSGTPGTTITAKVLPTARVNVDQAVAYITDFVALLDVPVRVNGTVVSGQPVERYVARPAVAWERIEPQLQVGTRLRADVHLIVSANGDLWLQLHKLVWSGQQLGGRLTIRSGASALRTYRSGFGLATVAVASHFQFGGIADLAALQPTAGREALTAEATQLLQSLVSEVEVFSSQALANTPESDSSTSFMNWVAAHGRYELCSQLRIAVYPGERMTLGEVAKTSAARPMLRYSGSDQSVITRHASDETPLLVLARTNPRRQCEAQFLNSFCKTEEISDSPVVEKRRSSSELTTAEHALAFRIESLIEADYFLKGRVSFGRISHGLPALVVREGDGIEIVLDSAGPTVALILGLYESEFVAFGSMVKDFVRTALFPRFRDYVPSSTSRGAEAFLRMIRAKGREVFEYEHDDLGSLASIWEDYADGRISMDLAVERSVAAVRSSVQVVDAQAAARVNDVVPDVVQNEKTIAGNNVEEATLEATPAITRLDTSSSARLLTIPESEPALRGYRCFLAITDKVREEMGEFFLQPHKTAVVWGGQKALFIFLHHSGKFGLYYDLQTREVIAAATGGLATPTCTIVLKDRIYIPIPVPIQPSFVPVSGEKKRFEIRCNLIRTEPS